MGHEERWTVVGLLALAGAMYALAWLFGDPAGAYLNPAGAAYSSPTGRHSASSSSPPMPSPPP